MSILRRFLLLTMLVAAPGVQSRAQESVPDSAEPASEPPQSTSRIVEGRPPLYSFKRAVHPLTWFEWMAKPVFRSAEDGRIKQWTTHTTENEKVSGVKFGVAGAGPGSGFGPVVTFFNKDLFGRGIDVEIPLLYTYSRYELYQFKASIPIVRESFVDRLSFDIGSRYASHAQDDFFALGNDSAYIKDVAYRTVSRDASAGFSVQFNDRWSSGIRAVYRNVGVTAPVLTGQSAQERFQGSSIPALFSGAALRSEVFDIRRTTQKQEDYTFTGGTDELEVSRNDSAGKGNFSYWKYRLESRHFLPVSADGRKVIAVRGLIETNRTNGTSQVPFFDMAWLGAAENLRGFEYYRFRDKSAVAASIEYRYRIWPRMDLGFYLDEGQVAPQLGDMSLNRFHTGYGTRLFIWPTAHFPISIDYGQSRETWRLYFNINTAF